MFFYLHDDITNFFFLWIMFSEFILKKKNIIAIQNIYDRRK